MSRELDELIADRDRHANAVCRILDDPVGGLSAALLRLEQWKEADKRVLELEEQIRAAREQLANKEAKAAAERGPAA